jgi:hypothetical protein
MRANPPEGFVVILSLSPETTSKKSKKRFALKAMKSIMIVENEARRRPTSPIWSEIP